ncbi:MAG: outer membrane protein transport protein [Candidatus Aminicenantes bacterium]|nr:outer membrane protein transport protein [Candidatus Aminicenantes bacterium]
MKKSLTLIVLFSLLFLGFSTITHGAGFLIYEHGAAAMAMGGAFVAVANNPTAIFHNPAGIAWLDGTQISFGSTLIIPKASLSLDNWPDPTYQSIDAVSQVFYPPTFYITHKISEKIVAGFGLFTPYGLGTEWPDPENFPLRYIATKDDMKTFIFNPTLAFKLSDNLSIAAGVSYIYSMLKFELVELVDLTAYGLSTYDMPAALDASGSGWGLNAGVLYKGDSFSFGVNWRGGFDIDYEGDLDLDTSALPITMPTSGSASTSFSFPHIFGVGAAFNLTEKLTITADVHYILWSSYDKFTVEIDVAGFEDKEVEENWKDSFVLRGGLEYKVNESFALRLGALYDQTPQPVETMDPILPDSNRWAITGGFGYKAGSFVIDVAYQFEPFEDRTSPNRSILLHPVTGANLGEGTYSTTAHLIGVSIGFVF